jgi:hypothetical protein
MVFSGGQFFWASVAGDGDAPAGCADAVAGFDAAEFEFAGAGSHAAAGTTFFLGCTFFAAFALGLLAGAGALGDGVEEGLVVSGGVGCCAVCSCATGAFADEADCCADCATSPASTDVSEEIPKNRMAAARVMLGPVQRNADLHSYYALM